MTKPRPILLLALFALLLPLLAPSAAAQTDEIESARDQRDKIRLEQENLLRSMDPLLDNLEDFEKAIEVVELARQEKILELQALDERLTFAQAESQRVLDAIALKRLDVELLRGAVAQQAVDAYTQQSDTDLERILKSTDFNQAGRRQTLYETVHQNGADEVDQLRASQSELADLLNAAQAAEADVVAIQVSAQQKLVEIDQAAAELAAAKATLDSRLESEFFSVAVELDSDYLRVTNEINQLVAAEEARLWQIEQARIAELRREEAARIAAQAAAEGTNLGLVQPNQQAPAFDGQLGWPLTGGVLTSNFGYRVHPIFGTTRLHEGIDLSANTGVPIAAAGSGTVIAAGNSGDGYGNKVVINHGDGLVTLYAHMNAYNVNVGAGVSGGTTIGTVGSTGNSTGPHLHFEVRVNGVVYDPLSYLP